MIIVNMSMYPIAHTSTYPYTTHIHIYTSIHTSIYIFISHALGILVFMYDKSNYPRTCMYTHIYNYQYFIPLKIIPTKI